MFERSLAGVRRALEKNTDMVQGQATAVWAASLMGQDKDVQDRGLELLGRALEASPPCAVR